MVTAGGLLLISGASPKLHIFDKATGKLVREIELGGGGFGNPMTYRTASGRQIIAIATSQGDGTKGKIVAFALPEAETSVP